MFGAADVSGHRSPAVGAAHPKLEHVPLSAEPTETCGLSLASAAAGWLTIPRLRTVNDKSTLEPHGDSLEQQKLPSAVVAKTQNPAQGCRAVRIWVGTMS